MKATRPREVVNFAHLRVPFVFCNQFTIILPALPLSSPVLVLKISILGCATCTELHAMLWNCNTKTIIYRNTIMEFGNTNQFWCSGILNKSRPMSSISFTRDFQPCSEWTNEHYTACRNTNQHHAPPPPFPFSWTHQRSPFPCSTPVTPPFYNTQTTDKPPWRNTFQKDTRESFLQSAKNFHVYPFTSKFTMCILPTFR